MTDRKRWPLYTGPIEVGMRFRQRHSGSVAAVFAISVGQIDTDEPDADQTGILVRFEDGLERDWDVDELREFFERIVP